MIEQHFFSFLFSSFHPLLFLYLSLSCFLHWPTELEMQEHVNHTRSSGGQLPTGPDTSLTRVQDGQSSIAPILIDHHRPKQRICLAGL
ncbi:hypothetical protein BDW60DRAFT_37940 [Aspergillus nidulans var. acristatus]